jgi:hypothetical protein
MELPFEGKVYLGAIALLGALSYALFGFTGVRTIVGFALLMVVPFYFIFSALNCTETEKMAFSFFAGIVIVPSVVYWLGFLVPFRIAMVLCFAFFFSIGVFLLFRNGRSAH